MSSLNIFIFNNAKWLLNMKNRNKTFLIILVIGILSCNNREKNQNGVQGNSSNKNKPERTVPIDSNNGVIEYLHFNTINEILNFENNEVMLISEAYYPNITFDTGGYVSMIFNVPDGAEFSYRLKNDIISVYYKENEMFIGTDAPSTGSLLFDVSLINDSTFTIKYYHKKWIDFINSKYLINEYSHLYFPTTFHCINP